MAKFHVVVGKVSKLPNLSLLFPYSRKSLFQLYRNNLKKFIKYNYWVYTFGAYTTSISKYSFENGKSPILELRSDLNFNAVHLFWRLHEVKKIVCSIAK